MNSSIYELIVAAALGGVVTGIIVPTVGEWLRGFFNGFHANNRRKKEKMKAIDYIRQQSDFDDIALNNPTTSSIHETIFPRKKIGYVFELLHELQREGRISITYVSNNNSQNETWHYITPTGKKYVS